MKLWQLKKKKRRQNQDLLENSCQQANAQSWSTIIILLQINIKALFGDFLVKYK